MARKALGDDAPVIAEPPGDPVRKVLEEMLDEVERVTVEDVQRVARDLFLPGSLSATVLGPVAGRPASEAQLGLQ